MRTFQTLCSILHLPLFSGPHFQFFFFLQVFLLGDFVIKLCVEEGGSYVAIDGLRSEVL